MRIGSGRLLARRLSHSSGPPTGSAASGIVQYFTSTARPVYAGGSRGSVRTSTVPNPGDDLAALRVRRWRPLGEVDDDVEIPDAALTAEAMFGGALRERDDGDAVSAIAPPWVPGEEGLKVGVGAPSEPHQVVVECLIRAGGVAPASHHLAEER